jgi:hypothetical protein
MRRTIVAVLMMIGQSRVFVAQVLVYLFFGGREFIAASVSFLDFSMSVFLSFFSLFVE